MNEKTLTIFLEFVNLLALGFYFMDKAAGAFVGKSPTNSSLGILPLIFLPVLLALTISILIFKNNKGSFVIFSVLSAGNIFSISFIVMFL